jgi:hypothetical protein
MWKIRDPGDGNGDEQTCCYLSDGSRSYYGGVGASLLNVTREEFNRPKELIKISLLLPTELL